MTDDREQVRIGAEIDRTGLSTDPFASAVRATRMPMIISDPNQPDNPIIFANSAFCKLTGYERDDILGRNCRFLQGAETDQGEIARIRTAIAERVAVEAEVLNYTKSGEPFWNRLLVSPVFDRDGALTYFFASQYNTTDVHEVQDALLAKSQEFEALAENVSQLAWMARPDGHVYWYNRRWYDYTGTTFETMQGWGWRDVFLPDRIDMITAEVSEHWAAGEAFEDVYNLRSASGEYRPFLTRAEPIRDEAGVLVNWLGTNTDISKQYEAERRLRELNESLEQRVAKALAERSKVEEQLRQSQKLETIGQLTGGVAHDFNNLLTVIKSSSDLLKRANLSEERRQRYVEAISDTVDRAAKLTSQLLAFARQQALKPEVFAVCDSVQALSGMMGTLTGSRIEVVTELSEEAILISADPSQFDTTIVNLAVNARDAMDGAGQLTIAVRAVEEVPAVRAHPVRSGAYVAVSVADTGSGIPADRVGKIFEPFFTTKGIGKGTGLGLSQVIGFVKQSGGEVTVESTLSEGTTFTLYLPRASVSDMATAEAEELEPLAAGHGTCVLVVEDNVDVGSVAQQTLTDLGYAVVLVGDAEKALAELTRDAGRFDVVFSDVVMPGIDGIELGQEIRRRYRDLPVILTSGYSHVLAQNGTYGFELLHKPYSVEQLGRILRKAATRQR